MTDTRITDEQVEELRWQIRDDLQAADAARQLLGHATFLIAAGVPLPERLRSVLCDGLEHIADTDPLAAFGHIRPPKKAGGGRRRAESDREWLGVMRSILVVHGEGFSLAHPENPKPPFLRVDGTAFHEYARRQMKGNLYAVNKEARRLQAGFWKHVKALPPAEIESLGLSKYLPAKIEELTRGAPL